MTPQTQMALKEAVEILNRIQGKDKTKFFFKELILHDKNSKKKEDKKHGTGAKG
jgi:hypothetical protein